MSKYIIIQNNADREWAIIIKVLLKDVFDVIIINDSDIHEINEPNVIIRFNQSPNDSIISNDALYIHIIYDEALFTPLYIDNAQSASFCSLTTAHEADGLSEQRCNVSYPLAINYVIVYFNNNNYVDNPHTYNIDFSADNANHKLVIHILKVMFLWFNYKPLYKSGIMNNSTALLETKQSDYNKCHTHYIFTKSLIDTEGFQKETGRGYFLHKYIKMHGNDNIKYIKNFNDNFNNFTWLKNFKYPIFGCNRHYSNKNCILFQLENYIDKTTLLNHKIYNIPPFQSKIKRW
jgi:hypothetical protein